MSWTSRGRTLLHRILRRRQLEDELDEEVRTYFEIHVERRMGKGHSREEALRATRLEYEGLEQVKEKVRDARMGSTIETVLQDLHYAARVLRKSPGFTFFAVLTIALALGANAAIFSLVDGVLLKPTSYPDPERIVQIWEKPPGYLRNSVSGANYRDWARQSRSFTAMAAISGGSMSFTGGGEPRSLHAQLVSAPYFEVFGSRAALGRTFARDEDQHGKEMVVVLTNRIWQGVFGGDQGIVGRQVSLNGSPFTVIGVLPGGTEYDRGWPDLFVPLVIAPDAARNYHYLSVVGRLRPDVSLQQAQSEMQTLATGIARLYPAVGKTQWSATIDRYLDRLVGQQMRSTLVILMSAVLAVLLIGCTNLANLLMARATLRTREIALRMALGAGRGRMVRMLLTESLLLSALGALLGIGLGAGLLRWIQSVLPPYYFPTESSIALDGRALLFLAAATVLTGMAFGLAPAIQAARHNSAESLKEGSRGGTAGRGRFVARQSFVMLQVAMAFILLTGGGLLLRSLHRLLNVDIGFDETGVVAAYLPQDRQKKPEAEQLLRYADRLVEEARSMPGIQEAALASALPMQGWGDGMPFHFPGKARENRSIGFKVVTPGYFPALRLRLIAGRILNEHDTAGSPPVIVVNDSFVRSYLKGQNPIGQRILANKLLPSRREIGDELSWEIVGVVSSEKSNGLDTATDDGCYASFAQVPVIGLGVVARGSGDTAALIKSLQAAVWRIDRNQVLDRPMTVTQLKEETVMDRRLPALLLGGFAVLALLLACAGIYGVLSFVTARRSQEMGIRTAMGATRGDLLRLVLGGGSIPVLAGIGAGFLGAMALARFLQSMLFATSALDTLTLFSVSALFLSVALLACFVPAWRAARVDPMTALRQE
ncbi:MAG: ABC transporter permease [Paludibaculum sp.]